MLGRSLEVWLRGLVILRFSNYGYCALINFFLRLRLLSIGFCVEIWLKFEYLGQFTILSFLSRTNVRSCCRVADAITGARDIYIQMRANATVNASKLEP